MNTNYYTYADREENSCESLKKAYKSISVNHDKLKAIVKKKYYDRAGKRLNNNTLEIILDCMDDMATSEWLNEIAEWQADIQARYDRTIETSEKTKLSKS